MFGADVVTVNESHGVKCYHAVLNVLLSIGLVFCELETIGRSKEISIASNCPVCKS